MPIGPCPQRRNVPTAGAVPDCIRMCRCMAACAVDVDGGIGNLTVLHIVRSVDRIEEKKKTDVMHALVKVREQRKSE